MQLSKTSKTQGAERSPPCIGTLAQKWRGSKPLGRGLERSSQKWTPSGFAPEGEPSQCAIIATQFVATSKKTGDEELKPRTACRKQWVRGLFQASIDRRGRHPVESQSATGGWYMRR